MLRLQIRSTFGVQLACLASLSFVLAASLQANASPTALPSANSSTKQTCSTKNADGHKMTEVAKDPQRLELENYLTAIKPLLKRYDAILLELIAPHSSLEKNIETPPSLSEVENLERNLGQLQIPHALLESHNKLASSLEPIKKFVTLGGVAKYGFGRGLAAAQSMHGAMDEFQSEIVYAMHFKSIPMKAAPFSYTEPEVVDTERASLPGGPALKGMRDDSSTTFLQGEKALGQVVQPVKSNSDPYGFVNGTDGANGMTGMFNGLGGTGTNGLVDGLGFSSGLNGLMNGMGNSSGMSGMMNDTSSGSSGNNR